MSGVILKWTHRLILGMLKDEENETEEGHKIVELCRFAHHLHSKLTVLRFVSTVGIWSTIPNFHRIVEGREHDLLGIQSVGRQYLIGTDVIPIGSIEGWKGLRGSRASLVTGYSDATKFSQWGDEHSVSRRSFFQMLNPCQFRGFV